MALSVAVCLSAAADGGLGGGFLAEPSRPERSTLIGGDRPALASLLSCLSQTARQLRGGHLPMPAALPARTAIASPAPVIASAWLRTCAPLVSSLAQALPHLLNLPPPGAA